MKPQKVPKIDLLHRDSLAMTIEHYYKGVKVNRSIAEPLGTHPSQDLVSYVVPPPWWL